MSVKDYTITELTKSKLKMKTIIDDLHESMNCNETINGKDIIIKALKQSIMTKDATIKKLHYRIAAIHLTDANSHLENASVKLNNI